MPKHRLPALRLALFQIIVWCTAALVRPSLAPGFLTGAIIFALISLYLVSRWADRVESKESKER